MSSAEQFSASNESDATLNAAPKRQYVPPHLRNRQAAPAPIAAAPSSNSARPAAWSASNNNAQSRWSENDARYAPPSESHAPRDFGGAFGSRGGDRAPHGGFQGGRGGGDNQRFGRPRDVEPNPFEEKDFLERVEQGINFDQYDQVPVETSGNDIPSPLESFDDLQLPEILTTNVKLAGYTRPTPVQKNAIPIALAARDLMACAQTGSGKTAAFLLPVIAMMLVRGPVDPNAGSGNAYARNKKFAPQGLVLAPTRELATQIYDQSRKFMYRSGMRSAVVYGGTEPREQFQMLSRGCDLLVATPGRLVDFVQRARITLSQVSYLVFDEADRMLDMGFEPQIRQIVEQEDMQSSETRQTLMFSATFPKEIQRLASDFLRDYIFLSVGRVGSTTESIQQRMELVEEHDKKNILMRHLEKCNGLTLIFVETKRNADYLENVLVHDGINATSIHGDRSQQEREMALSDFRSGRSPVLVATDVAARGLDIPNVMHVINYDLPNDIDSYVHRIGRTGRCGNVGTAISFVNERSKGILRDILELLKESNQEVPQWFESMCHGGAFGGRNQQRGGRGGYGGRGGGGGFGGGRSGGNGFGGRDFRSESGGYGAPAPPRQAAAPAAAPSRGMSSGGPARPMSAQAPMRPGGAGAGNYSAARDAW